MLGEVPREAQEQLFSFLLFLHLHFHFAVEVWFLTHDGWLPLKS